MAGKVHFNPSTLKVEYDSTVNKVKYTYNYCGICQNASHTVILKLSNFNANSCIVLEDPSFIEECEVLSVNFTNIPDINGEHILTYFGSLPFYPCVWTKTINLNPYMYTNNYANADCTDLCYQEAVTSLMFSLRFAEDGHLVFILWGYAQGWGHALGPYSIYDTNGCVGVVERALNINCNSTQPWCGECNLEVIE